MSSVIKESIYRLLTTVFGLFPVRKFKALFISNYGSHYGCNPKYLSEYMSRVKPKWNLVWAFTDPTSHSIPGIKKVRYLSLGFFYDLCTSHIVVSNCRMPLFFQRRKKQYYIQTWHSSLRLKAIEADATNSLSGSYVRMAQHDSRQVSVLLSGCNKSSEIFRRSFWYDGPIAATGTPRMDFLLKEDRNKIIIIKESLGIPRDAHVALYAPTFRESRQTSVYDMDIRSFTCALKEKWDGEWFFLIRLHPLMSGKHMPGICNVQDVSDYDDIQELLYISDVVVSDYSSLIFDFAMTGRPCFLYVPDLEDYLKTERDLYFNIEDLPFPLIRNNANIREAVTTFNSGEYKNRVGLFLGQIGSFEDGNACRKVYDLILQQL